MREESRWEVHEGGAPARKWTLILLPDRLRLESAGDAPSVEVPRPEIPHKVEILHGLVFRRVLVIKKGKPFQLKPDAFAALQAWMGPPTREDLKVALRRRMGWTLPIGAIFVLGSLPIEGPSPQPFVPVTAGLGASLILLSVVSRLAPNRVFFLLDSIWFVGLAAETVRQVVVGESGPVWLALVAFQLAAAGSGLRQYRRFGALA